MQIFDEYDVLLMIKNLENLDDELFHAKDKNRWGTLKFVYFPKNYLKLQLKKLSFFYNYFYLQKRKQNMVNLPNIEDENQKVLREILEKKNMNCI